MPRKEVFSYSSSVSSYSAGRRDRLPPIVLGASHSQFSRTQVGRGKNAMRRIRSALQRSSRQIVPYLAETVEFVKSHIGKEHDGAVEKRARARGEAYVVAEPGQ